jgi:hypothetical protein
MLNTVHTMSELFDQLGLESDQASMDAFIAQHSGVCTNCTLVKAPIWNASQQAFLQSAIAEDSEWAMVAEQLTAKLS